MKKTNFKKVLSVFLAVLMIMSCWVFVPGEHQIEAEAHATLSTYRTADKYGTPYWNGSDVYYSKWKSGTTYTKFTWPKHIYLDVSESLQSAGYYYTVNWLYGTGTDYRTIGNGFIFGGWGIGSGYPTNYYTMTNMFNNYNLDASLPTPDNDGGTTQVYESGNTSGDLYVGVSGLDWSGAKAIIWRNPDQQNAERTSYVFLTGTPKSTGTGRYSTSEAKPSNFGGWQQWGGSSWSNKGSFTTKNSDSNWETDCYEGTWKEVAFDITIYDKSTLNAAINSKTLADSESVKYTDASWNAYKTALNNAKTVLKTRETTQTAITNAKNELDSKYAALEFKTFTISFNTPAASTSVASKTYKYGNVLGTTLDVPTRTGYMFARWYADTVVANGKYDSGEEVTDANGNVISSLQSYAITQNWTLYSDWVPIDVNYDNLFSLSEWAASAGAVASNGTNIADVSVDLNDNSISITTGPTSAYEEGYTAQTNGAGYYRFKVEPSTKYILEYDYDCADANSVIWLWYNTSANAGSSGNQSNCPAGNGHKRVEFTTAADTSYITLRFNIFAYNTTGEFSNIAVYKADKESEIASVTNRKFRINAPSKGSDLYTPVRTGYTFNGWFYDEACTSAVGANDVFTKSTTVYSKWTINKYTITWKNYNGTVLETDTVEYGEIPSYSGATPTKASDATNEYIFSNSWSPAVGAVTGNITYIAQFDAKVHSYGNAESYDATNHTYTCTNCGYVKKEAHTKVTDAAKDSTCTEPGLTAGEHCSVCKKVFVSQEVVPANGHKEVTVAGKAATCTETGLTEGKKCSVCDTTIVAQQTIPELGHLDENKDHVCDRGCGVAQGTCSDSATDNDHLCDYGCGKVLETCSDKIGDGDHKCDICGADNVTDHTKGTAQKENITEATCGSAGKYDSVYRCTECNTEMQRINNIKIEKLPHDWQSATYSWTADGKSCTATRVCANNAGHTETETVNATGVQKVAPTCEAMGSTLYTATFTATWAAQQTMEVYDVPANDHTPAEAVTENNVPATCTKDGSYDTVIYCSVVGCEKQISRVTTTVPATGHADGTAVVENNVDATCTTDGSYDNVTYCTVCGVQTSRNTITVPQKGHTPGEAATCTTAQVCTVCNAELAEALQHDYKAVVTDPTCTEEGYTTYTCTRCDDAYTDDEVDALDHSFTKYVSNNDATCLGDGTKTAKCDRCDVTDKVIDVGSALGHDYKSVVTAPTCTEKGYTTHTCTRCDNSYVDTYTGALEHAWSDTYTMESDGKDGKHYQTCTRENCDAKNEAVAHTWNDGVEYPEADCENAGTMTYTCTAKGCGATYIETVNPDGHSLGEWIEEIPATCKTTGTKGHYECTVCHKYFAEDKATVIDDLTIEINPDNHDLKTTAKKDPTCTEIGWDEYVTCQREGCNYTTYKEIVATGHAYGNWTFVADGQHKSVCANDANHVETEACADSDTDTDCLCDKCNELVAHSYGNATCEAPAICTVCRAETGSALGHTWTDATCTVPKTCSVCSTTDGNALGHAYGNWTFVADGQHKRVCANDESHVETEACADSSTDDNCLCDKCNELVAHNYGNATCDAPATCTVCGNTTGDKLGHTWGDPVLTKAPSADAQGEYTETCATCGGTQITKVNLANYDAFDAVVAQLSALAETENLTDTAMAYIAAALAKAEALSKNLPADATTADGKVINGAQGTIVALSVELNAYAAAANTAIEDGSFVKPDYVAAEDAINEAEKLGDKLSEEDKAALELLKAELENIKNDTDSNKKDAQTAVDAIEEAIDVIISKYETVCDHVDTYRYSETYAQDKMHQAFCKECGEKVGEPVACTYSGNLVGETCYEYVFACTGCGYYYTEDRAETEHMWSPWAYESGESCMSATTRTRTCTRCLFAESEVYKDKDGNVVYGAHSLIIVEGKDATCTRDGATDYRYCVTCGMTEQSEPIPAFNHPDKNDDGNCDICGYMVDASKGKCSCLCHNDSLFGGIIFKIAKFFWKLFKMNETCLCGIKHW